MRAGVLGCDRARLLHGPAVAARPGELGELGELAIITTVRSIE